MFLCPLLLNSQGEASASDSQKHEWSSSSCCALLRSPRLQQSWWFLEVGKVMADIRLPTVPLRSSKESQTAVSRSFKKGCDVASFWRWSNECNECFWSLIEREDELLMNYVFFCFRPTVETTRKQFFVWLFSFLPTLEYLSVRLKWLKSKANPSRSKQPDTTLISAQCQLVCDALLKERSCP